MAKSLNPLSTAIVLFFALIMAVPAHAASESAEVAFEQGLSAYEESDWAGALRFFDQAIATDPNYASAHHYRGMTLMQLQQPEEAVKALEKARELDPNARDVFLDLGSAYLKAKRPDDAIAAFKEEINRHPDNANAHFALGYALISQKRYSEATEPLAKSRELDPGLNVPARFYEGVALYGMNKRSEAAAAFKEVLAMNPPSDIASASRKYLDAIEKGGEAPKSWGVAASLLYQYDTNVVAANDQTDFPVTILDDEVSGQEDSRAVVTLFGRWNFLNRDPWSAEARYSFYQSFHFEIDTFNLQNHAPELTGARTLSAGGRDAMLSLNYRAGAAFLGPKLDWYSVNHWVTPTFTVKWSDMLATALSYRFNYEDFESEDPNRDNIAHSGIVDATVILGKIGTLRGSVGYDLEDADNEDYDVQRPWVNVSLDLTLPAKIRTRISLYYENENHYSSSDDRVDDVFSAEFLAFRPIWGPIEGNINVNYRLNNSTEDVFEYERTIVGGGVVVRL